MMAGWGLRRWTQVKWSLWKHAAPTAANAVISVLCYLIGWSVSSRSDPGGLVHAGAFATAVSVAFTLHDYRDALAKGEALANDTFERIAQNFPLTGAAFLDRTSGKAAGNTRRADRRIRWTQAVLLILATLVWGFADLAPKWAPWLLPDSTAERGLPAR